MNDWIYRILAKKNNCLVFNYKTIIALLILHPLFLYVMFYSLLNHMPVSKCDHKGWHLSTKLMNLPSAAAEAMSAVG